MKNNYSFLNDELALLEIRKHKWIESERSGREIGFATAAVEWVKKYGDDWLRYRLGFSKREKFFSEKRNQRRFSCSFPILFESNNIRFVSCANDINLVAISCVIPKDLIGQEALETFIDFSNKNPKGLKSAFKFTAKVLRASPLSKKNSGKLYHIVLSLNDCVRDYLRGHADALFYSPA
ncbi:MAG: hypothetical protein ABIJ41_04015 [Candidatus Omnitrophota bacterium]